MPQNLLQGSPGGGRRNVAPDRGLESTAIQAKKVTTITTKMKIKNHNQNLSSLRPKHSGFVRLGLLCLMGVFMVPIHSYAGIRAGFIDVKPLTRTAVIKNGDVVDFSAKLVVAPVGPLSRPVNGVTLDCYLKRPGKKDPERIGRVVTDARGSFILRKRIVLAPHELKTGQASISWFVDVIKAPSGILVSGTNYNAIAGWGVRVVL